MTTFLIHRAKIAFLISLVILFLGARAFIIMPKEAAPEIKYGIAIISTFYDGASSIDMDKLVTQEIENKIKDVKNINKIKSTSKNSFSNIVVEFNTDTDMTKALSDLRNKIDEVKTKLPENAEDPNLTEIDSTMQAIFNVHLTGDIHPVLLKDYAKKLQSHLEQLSYVRDVEISGGADRKIYIDVDNLKLHKYGISTLDIINTIKSTHKDNPIGEFQINNLDYSIRIKGQLENAEQIRNTFIKSTGSSFLKIEDIANVYETNENIDHLENFYDTQNATKTSQTVKLQVFKANQSDIFKVDSKVKEKIKTFVTKNFGNEIKINFTNQMIVYTKDSYNTVYSSAISSIIIVFLLLMIFIGLKEAIIASMVIPLSFLTTFAVVNSMDISLSFLINFSLILSLGILVDTSIVIVEGIYEHIDKGLSPKEAASKAVLEFQAPLISGCLTTLAVFIPLLVLPGIMGKYLSYIPIAVSIVLVSSLCISLFIVPAIATVFLKPKSERKTIATTSFGILVNKFYKKRKHIINFVINHYQNFTSSALQKKSWRYFSILSVIILCFLTFLLPIKFTLFPSDDFDIIMAEIKLPEGTTSKETEQASFMVEEIIAKYPEVKSIETSISNNTANILISLLRKKDRENLGLQYSLTLVDSLRDDFKQFQNYDVLIQELEDGPPQESPVAFKIITEDASKLIEAQTIAKELKGILKTIPGTSDIKIDISNTPGEFTFKINRMEALRLGVNPDQISILVRTAIKGSDIATITRDGREIDINIRYNEEILKTFDDIKNIQIQNKNGEFISLNQVVDINFNQALSEIKRMNRKIAVTVSSQLTRDGNAMEITQAFYEKIKNYNFPEGIFIEDSGETSENMELIIAMGTGFAIAIFLMFCILVIQFNSFLLPFIILFTIIMSLLGVNIGLYLTGTPRSLAFMIGFISLAGIVVNDAIILVDRIKNLHKKYPKLPLHTIIAQAGGSRLQPIILTTLTTAAGVFPLIFVDVFWSGLSYTIIFGLSVASFLTLFVTPSMYYLLVKKK